MNGKEEMEGSSLDDKRFWSVALTLTEGGNQARFKPSGSSMSPFIRDGETVTVTSCSPKELKFGDIILYAISSDPITSPKRIHRVIGKSFLNGKFLLLTKGDACPSPDAPVDLEQVLGKVSAVEKGRWTLDLNQPWGKAINLSFALFQQWPVSRWLMAIGWKGLKSSIGFLG